MGPSTKTSIHDDVDDKQTDLHISAVERMLESMNLVDGDADDDVILNANELQYYLC